MNDSEGFVCPICGLEMDDEGELFDAHLPGCEAALIDGDGGGDVA